MAFSSAHMCHPAPPCGACGLAAFMAPTPVGMRGSPMTAVAAAPQTPVVRRRPPVAISRNAQRTARAPPRLGLLGGGRVPSKKVVIERPLPNRRVVSSGILIHAPLDTVWNVLSDYSRLADYIPNLAISKLQPHPKGGIRLQQCGVQKILGFEFKAAVTMDMTEVSASSGSSRAIDFNLVESRDFKVFEGTWLMELSPDDADKTVLQYRVTIVPRGMVPVKAIEWRIGEDIPGNMDAVKRECERRRRQEAISLRRATARAQNQ